MVARKVRIFDLVNGEFLREENRSFVKTVFGNVSEVRILATVVDTFTSEDRSFSTITLDDGTETLRVKTWNQDVEVLQPFEKGDFVECLGWVREYNNEIYLIPELIKKVSPNKWILRELEILESLLKIPKEEKEELVEEEVLEEIEENVDEEDLEEFEILDEDEIAEKVFSVLKKGEMDKKEIMAETQLDEIDVELALRELLDMGKIKDLGGKFKVI